MEAWEPGKDHDAIDYEGEIIEISCWANWPDLDHDGEYCPASSKAWRVRGHPDLSALTVFQTFTAHSLASQGILTLYEGKAMSTSKCWWQDGSGYAPWPDGWTKDRHPLSNLSWFPTGAWQLWTDWRPSQQWADWLPDPWGAVELSNHPEFQYTGEEIDFYGNENIVRNVVTLSLPGEVSGSDMRVDNPFMEGGKIKMNYYAWNMHQGCQVITYQQLSSAFGFLGITHYPAIPIVPLVVGGGMIFGPLLLGGGISNLAAAGATTASRLHRKQEEENN